MYEKDEWNRSARRFRTRELESGKLCIMNETENVAVVGEFNADDVEVVSISGEENISIGIQSTQKPMEPGDVLNLSYKLLFTKADEVK